MSDPTPLRVLTEPLGGSALSRAVQDAALPAPLQPWRPRSAAEWSAHASRVRASADRDWLAVLRPAFNAVGAAADRLEHAARDGIVITTGQQAGLFGGPLYTLSKAISALALADALEKSLGLPVAPVFWAATDDADFLEASAVHVADAEGVRRLALEHPPAAGTPMARTPLGDTTALLRELHRACGSAPHSRFFDMARAAFSGNHTVGTAYVELLRDLLYPLGIAVIDSSHAVVRAAAMPLMARATSRADAVHDALVERARAMRAAGHEPQVDDDRGLSLVFAHERGLKRRLSVDEARALEIAREDVISPNVLLRPVVERAILPTAAYVAGPGELAYFTQVSVVADALGAAVPVALPRWSATVIEPHTARALGRLGIDHAEASDAHALEARFARAAMPAAVTEPWARLEERLAASIEELDRGVREANLVPPAVIEGLRRTLAHKLARAERRLLAAAKRRDDQVRRDIITVTSSLFPNGKRQERVLSFIPMLARGGDGLLAAMLDEARRHAAALVPSTRAEPVAAR
jgi:bacillithiol biosynthesis cysteine-adding enzyme BshC